MQEISPIKQRILQFADSLPISKREFYAKTGISRGTLDNSSGITEETLAKFFDTYKNVSPQWVLFGTGEIYISDNHNRVSEEPGKYKTECKFCAEKDRTIEALKLANKALNMTIDTLSDRLNDQETNYRRQVG